MFTVALTGGIASGKTTVSKLFAKIGIEIIDADQVSRQVVTKGQPALEQIKTYFGDKVITQDGGLNRAKMREIVFANEEKRQWLNQLLHPLIRQSMQDQAKAAKSIYVIMEIPLLVESQQENRFNRILLVDVDKDAQLNRIQQRDQVSRQQAIAILKTQAKREERLAVADDVIVNNGKIDELGTKVKQLHQLYSKLAIIQEKSVGPR